MIAKTIKSIDLLKNGGKVLIPQGRCFGIGNANFCNQGHDTGRWINLHNESRLN